MVGELELAWRLVPNRFVAVTGTNGKTTVTELLGHLWRTAAEPVAVAGNVGTPLASLVGEVPAEATIVCECSSFQLEDSEAFAPECAVLLNATPDHLDRHRDFDHYLRAKLRIFANQGNDDVAVYNASEAALRDLDLGGCARRVAFCRSPNPDCEVSLSDGVIFAGDEPLLEASELRLIGPHNADNAMAAAAAALAMGLERDAVREGLRELRRASAPARARRRAGRRPLRQRLQGHQRRRRRGRDALVRRRRAGDPRRLAEGRGLQGAGGAGEREMRRLLSDRRGGRVARAGPRARPRRRGGAAPLRGARRRRLGAAAADAQAGEVVLLSPACASFDAYRDFEQRGEHFRSLVEGLGGQAESGYASRATLR